MRAVTKIAEPGSAGVSVGDGNHRFSAGFWFATATVAALLICALLLRLWGIANGLPFAFNVDENGHFVPKAIGLFGHGYNPGYFINPPGYTYVLHFLMAIWFGGGRKLGEQFALDPTPVFVLARIVAAVMGTIAIWFLYLAGARMFVDRRVGVLAAGTLTFAFLPVFYGHLALNDVPTLLPICAALWAIAGVWQSGRGRYVALSAFAIGVACAFKYTAGITVLVLVAAALLRADDRQGRSRLWMLTAGAAIAALCGAAGFLVANPYALLDFSAFINDVRYQSQAADDTGKLGLVDDNGIIYYLWSMTWGFGWVPLIAVCVGSLLLLIRRARLALVLVLAPLLFLIFMGIQSRFFGRWMLPIYPMLALIGAYAPVALIDLVAARRRAYVGAVLTVIAAVLLWGQGFFAAIHIGSVLSKRDTRNLTRAWMVENVPAGSKIVVEPVMPDAWAQDVGRPSPLTSNGNRWVKYAASRTNLSDDGRVIAGRGRIVGVERYQRTLYPGLLDRYERDGFCWVVSGSTQRGRSDAQPDEVPLAIAYYRELERRGELVYHASPYRKGARAVPFNFDWSFDYYPRAYERSGPEVWVYRLGGGRCG